MCGAGGDMDVDPELGLLVRVKIVESAVLATGDPNIEIHLEFPFSESVWRLISQLA